MALLFTPKDAIDCPKLPNWVTKELEKSTGGKVVKGVEQAKKTIENIEKINEAADDIRKRSVMTP